MRNNPAIFFLLLVNCFIDTSIAQSYLDIFEINHQLSPSNQYSGLKDEVNVSNSTAFLRLPLQRENGDVWLPGISFRSVNLDSDIEDQGTPGTFGFVRLELGYQKKWSDSLNMVAIFLPRLSSDFKDVDDRSVQFGGLVVMNNKKSDKFTFKYGLYFNTEFFGFFTTPLIGGDLKVNKKLRLFGLLPANANVEYTLNKNYRTGLTFISFSTSYRMTESPTLDYMHHLTNTLSWFNDIYLTKSIVFRGQVGFSAFRYYRKYQNDDRLDLNITGIAIGGDREPVFEGKYSDFGDGIILQAALIYRYDLGK